MLCLDGGKKKLNMRNVLRGKNNRTYTQSWAKIILLPGQTSRTKCNRVVELGITLMPAVKEKLKSIFFFKRKINKYDVLDQVFAIIVLFFWLKLFSKEIFTIVIF